MSNYEQTNTQVPFNIYGGYRFTPVHSLRLQGSYYSATRQGSTLTNTALSGEIQYLANLNNFLNGYNPNRKFAISTLLSAGLRYIEQENKQQSMLLPFATAGFDISANLGPNFSIFAQPYVGITKNQTKNYTVQNPAPYNLYYGTNVGIGIKIGASEGYFDSIPLYCRSYFIEGSTGWTVGSYGRNLHQTGTGFHVSIGRWFDPAIGVRLGFGTNETYWNRSTQGIYDIYNKRMNAAGRFEFVSNLAGFMPKYRKKDYVPRFELDLSLGAQYGYSIASGVPNLHKEGDKVPRYWANYYYGFTAAMQALYKVSPGSYIFIEPRFLNNYYRIPYVDIEGKEIHKTRTDVDQYATLSVGARVYTASRDERKDYQQEDFTRHWWVGADLGGTKLFQSTRVVADGFGSLQPTLGINAGYDLSPLASLRLQTEWQHLARTVGEWNNRYQKVDFRMMYMLPFTNLIRGYKKDNKFHVYLEAGPTFSVITGQKNTPIEGIETTTTPADRIASTRLGLMGGALLAYDIRKTASADDELSTQKPYWDVFAESQVQYHARNSKGIYTPGGLNSLSDIQYGLSVGTRYHFMPYGEEKFRELNLNVPGWQRGWFIEGSYGWAFPTTKDFIHASGSSYRINVGRWLSPLLGLRLGIHAQQHYLLSSKEDVGSFTHSRFNSQILAAGELDVLTDPLNFSKSGRAQEERKFDLNLGMGLLFGQQALTRTHTGTGHTPQIGFTALAQALYTVAPGVQVFAEPRVLNVRYNAGSLYENPRVLHPTDRMMTLSVGARITNLGDKASAPMFAKDSTSQLFHRNFVPHWWLGAEIGGVKSLNLYKSIGAGSVPLQPSLNMSLGYDLHPLVTFRGQIQLSRLGNLQNDLTTVSHPRMYDAQLLYMLNLTNLWQGTRNMPRFGVYPELGAGFTRLDGNNTLSGVAGAMLSYSITHNWDALAESQVQLTPGSGYKAVSAMGKSVSPKWGLYVGTRYNFMPYGKEKFREMNLEVPAWQRGWFVEGSYGWAFPTTSGASAIHSSGSSYRINVGHWFSPLLGVRLGIHAQQHYNTSGEYQQGDITYTRYHEQILASGEVDILTDPLNFSKKARGEEERRFDLNLGAGLLFGQQIQKTGSSSRLRTPQVGFTALAQALYTVAPGVQLYAEPRLQTTHYNKNGFSLAAIIPTDRMFTLSVGARITTMGDKASAPMFANSDLYQRTFVPHWWVGLQAGGVKTLNTNKDIAESSVPIQPAFTLSAGYDLHPLVTFKGQVEYASLGSLQNDKASVQHANLYDLRLIYMLNLTNLWQNTRIQPRFSAYPEVGISMSRANGKNSLGGVAGAMTSYSITSNWDAVAEAQVQFNAKAGFMPFQNSGRTRSGRWGMSVGTRYHIAPGLLDGIHLSTPQWMKGWFLEGAYGWSLPLGTGQAVGHMSGSNYELRAGHWFTHYLGARFGVQANQGHWTATHSNAKYYDGKQVKAAYSTSKLSMQAGGRVELLLNPVNLFRDYNVAETPQFDMNLSLGLDFGAVAKSGGNPSRFMRGYKGFTAAVQALYNMAPGVQAFIEPRYHSSQYTVPEEALGTSEKACDRHFAINIGTRIMRPEKAKRNEAQKEEDTRTAASPLDNLWLSASLGGMKSLQTYHTYTSGPNISPKLSIGAGYDLNPLSSFRLQMAYGMLNYVKPDMGYATQTSYGVTMHYKGTLNYDMSLLNTQLTYMLNLSNLWQGTQHNNSPFNLYLEAGLSYNWHLGTHHSLVRGEVQGGTGSITPGSEIYYRKSTPGLVAGAMASMKVNSNWDVTLHTTGQLNILPGFTPCISARPFANVHLDFGVGTRYHF